MRHGSARPGQRVAVVTGASSGIGEAAVRELLARGFIVYAAARNVQRMAGLEERGARLLALDLTDDAQIVDAVGGVLQATGRIDVLVNNAGYGAYGAVEDVPIAGARRQFEVNVFAPARLAQLVAPGMRAAGSGRIINVSSMGARFSTALGGWYHATKWAVEALSHAERQELGPHGVKVVIVAPGLIRTGWAAVAADHLRRIGSDSPYRRQAAAFAVGLDEVTRRRIASDPAVIGRVIAHAAVARHPRIRYTSGRFSLVMTALTRLIPVRLADAVVTGILARVGGRLARNAAGPEDQPRPQ